MCVCVTDRKNGREKKAEGKYLIKVVWNLVDGNYNKKGDREGQKKKQKKKDNIALQTNIVRVSWTFSLNGLEIEYLMRFSI